MTLAVFAMLHGQKFIFYCFAYLNQYSSVNRNIENNGCLAPRREAYVR